LNAALSLNSRYLTGKVKRELIVCAMYILLTNGSIKPCETLLPTCWQDMADPDCNLFDQMCNNSHILLHIEINVKPESELARIALRVP
jgi:hypothetical protein